MKPKIILQKIIIQFILISVFLSCTNYVYASESKSEGEKEGAGIVIKDKSRYLLATIREGDFPFIGGSEAIALLLDKLTTLDPLLYKGNILEIGGGHGGNANYLLTHGLNNIQVTDIDEEAIKYGQSKYPNINFKLLNATKLTGGFGNDSFDLIYMIGSSHAIGDKLVLLQKLKAVSKSGALLAIMDYNLKSAKESDKLSTNDGVEIYPLNLEKLIPQMKYIGWEVVETTDISELYKNWYISVLSMINISKDTLLTNGYLEAEIKFIEDKFNLLLTMITEGKLGAILIIVRKI